MRLFAMSLPDGCVECLMGGPLHKVDDLCVVPFTRSLSAEGSVLLVRILIAITPRMYGEVLALTIHRRRPDFEVLLAPPGSLEGEIERFVPHVLVQDAEEAEPASQAFPDGVLHCIRILNANDTPQGPEPVLPLLLPMERGRLDTPRRRRRARRPGG